MPTHPTKIRTSEGTCSPSILLYLSRILRYMCFGFTHERSYIFKNIWPFVLSSSNSCGVVKDNLLLFITNPLKHP